jgi:isopenicillin N synthase-like dioxygenase
MVAFALFFIFYRDWRMTYNDLKLWTPKALINISACRDILEQYSKQVMKLGILVFGLLSEALGLNPNHLNDIDCTEGLSVACHYYPASPQPELTIGTSKHADGSFLTVLLQDHIGGLQVLHQDKWVDNLPVPGALVVNIGDLLQASLHIILAFVRVYCFWSIVVSPYFI